MKFYNQSGTEFQRTSLHQSDNVCTCCQQYEHKASEYHHDDAVCEKCSMLCCCGCHRERRP